MQDSLTPFGTIERTDFGSCLVLAGNWSPSVKEFMLTRGITALKLNYAQAWEGNDLAFLRDAPFLQALNVLNWELEDISAIHNLHGLRAIGVSSKGKPEIDCTQFPHLESAAFAWSPKRKSIFACKVLNV